MDIEVNTEFKKRPLSISFTSPSPSCSSSRRLPKKRLIGNNKDEEQGRNNQQNMIMDTNQSNKSCSNENFESRNSIDSGVVDPDKHDEKLDDVSLASSETSSCREDLVGSFRDDFDASASSFRDSSTMSSVSLQTDRSDLSLIDQRLSDNFENNELEESNSKKLLNTREKARQKFFSNYEDHIHGQSSQSESSIECHYNQQNTNGFSGTTSPIKISLENEIESQQKLASSSKKETFNSVLSAQKSMFGRASKKKEMIPGTEVSKTSQVYVNYVQRVVAEIVDSERIYISSLEDIIYGYLEPMEETLREKPLLSKDLIDLFSNVREIYNFNRIFLSELEMAGLDPGRVAQCFVKHNEGFVIYTDYCTNYPRAVEVLTKFMLHPELNELCKERQLALGHGLPLGAYLLKPVQRILKYHLLLQNIVKNFEKSSSETKVLEEAFNHMTHMAHHINEMKRKHEHAVRIQEIQSQLEDYAGEDLTRLGELAQESTFKIYGAKASRQVFLFEKGLLISKKKEGGMLSCKTFIQCSNLMLVEVIPNEPLSFHVIPFDNPRAQYTLQARNMEQKRRWCNEVKRLILESFKGKIPDNVKSLVMQLGRNHDDDYVTKEALDAVRKTQHTAPEYLEKRRFRRKSGTRIPDFSLLRPQKVRKGNKKTENKSIDRSPEVKRRAESKSPDVQRKLFSKQNTTPQRRSQSNSLPTTPISNSSCDETKFLNKSYDSHSYPSTEPSTPVDVPKTPPSFPNTSALVCLSRQIQENFHEVAVPHGTANMLHKNTGTKSAFEQTRPYTEEEKREISKRAASFRQALQTQPLTSQDLTDLVARCGGITTNLVTDRQTLDEQKSGKDGKKNLKTKTACIDSQSKNILKTTKTSCELSKSGGTLEKGPNKQGKWTSMPVLNDRINCSGSQENVGDSEDDTKPLGYIKKSTQSCDDVFEKSKGRLSRRDITTQAKRCDKIKEKDLTTKNINAFNDNKKAIVRRNCLRIPNTSKHISGQYAKNNKRLDNVSKAKLTDWGSVEALPKDSLNDVSYLKEDPWIKNANNVEMPLSASPPVKVTNRPRGFSDASDVRRNPYRKAHSKENLDWIVYLNRTSNAAPLKISQLSKTSKSPLRQFKKETQRIISDKIPYATPPRSFMTPENMKKIGSLSSPIEVEEQILSEQTAYYPASVDTVNNSVTLPSHSASLSRCHSQPTATPAQEQLLAKLRQTRPYSMDMERLTDERNRMVAEMEDYINRTVSIESISNTSKFPTFLPSITVEEDIGSNRLSVDSSISTSSYESQGSSSSDGLVGTLKSKLSSWAADTINNLHSSQNSMHSNGTSDEDVNNTWSILEINKAYKEENAHEPNLKHTSSFKDKRQLESVLREHSLGSSFLGSRMAHNTNSQYIKQLNLVDKKCDDPPRSSCDAYTLSAKIDNSQEKDESLLRFSMPPSKDALEVLMPNSLTTCKIQKADSEFSLQSSVSTVNEVSHPQRTFDEVNEKKTDSCFLTSENPHAYMSCEYVPLNRQNSSESIDSTDSFYERRLSIAFGLEPLTEFSNFDEKQNKNSLPRKTIKEFVKQIEEKYKPKSPKVFEVRRKEPSAMIKQKLETLQENFLSSDIRSSSRNVSEERELFRSKSQPPSSRVQSTLNPTRCSDDIHIYSSNTSLSRSKESLTISSDGHRKRRSKSPEKVCIVKHSSDKPGHESYANMFRSTEDYSKKCAGQFVHRKHGSNDSIDRKALDQMSTEVDNLIIMKGWVRSLISKFQSK